MNKYRIGIAATLMSIGAILIPASFAERQVQDHGEAMCRRYHARCENLCQKYRNAQLLASCRRSCEVNYKSCLDAAKAKAAAAHPKKSTEIKYPPK
jgi:hypothetical protein